MFYKEKKDDGISVYEYYPFGGLECDVFPYKEQIAEIASGKGVFEKELRHGVDVVGSLCHDHAERTDISATSSLCVNVHEFDILRMEHGIRQGLALVVDQCTNHVVFLFDLLIVQYVRQGSALRIVLVLARISAVDLYLFHSRVYDYVICTVLFCEEQD